MGHMLLAICIFAGVFATTKCEDQGPLMRKVPQRLDLETSSNETNINARKEKFFSLFTVVRFNNDACVSTKNLSGTCLTSAECSSGGGTAGGTCAGGFGVCCVFTFSGCGSTTSRNCTYFTTPTISSSGQSCMYMINKCSPDVCQMRIDFLSFQIAQPNKVAAGGGTTATATNCIQDQFFITNAATSYSPICGLNTGQHMYMDVSNSNFIKLNFALTSTNTAPNPASPTRTWNIKVTQIPCCSYSSLAPPGCLQYFTELSGTITSFNYDTTTSANSYHLANQDYSICFRMEPNYCTICYTVCDTSTANAATQFDLSAGGAAGATAAMNGVGTAACFNDYVIIPGGYNQGTTMAATANDRLCGQFFNAITATTNAHVTVCSATKPFRFSFKTSVDETAGEVATGGVAGFCLRYNQLPCAGSG